MFSFGAVFKLRQLKFPSGMFFLFDVPRMLHIPRTMDEMIRMAITEKRLLEFDYDDYHRVVEPHIYGRKNNKNGMLVYQLRGQSSTGKLGWKRMYMKNITNMRVLDETFLGVRDVAGPHSKWDLYYLIVDDQNVMLYL